MNSVVDIAVVGAGAWGTALAVLYAEQGYRVTLVARDAGRAAMLARERVNPRLPGVVLPDGLRVSAVPVATEVTLLCPPFQHLRATVGRMPAGNGILILCCKGVEGGTARLGPEILAELVPDRAVGVLTGPNFAHEVAGRLPAAGVLAIGDPVARGRLVAMLATPRFRLYGSGDLIGAALGGAGKNVIAIAAGAVIGAGLGENARAGLITRGLAEIARLATALGGASETIAGLAGLGDLILTATGGASRNYRAGLALGRGSVANEADGVVEGVATAPALLARAREVGCEMPVTASVVDLLAGRVTLADSMNRLLRRDLKDES